MSCGRTTCASAINNLSGAQISEFGAAVPHDLAVTSHDPRPCLALVSRSPSCGPVMFSPPYFRYALHWHQITGHVQHTECSGQGLERHRCNEHFLDSSKETPHNADHRQDQRHLVGRCQAPGLGGGGRERPSGREPPPAKLLRLWSTAKKGWSDRPARVRQASAQKAESTSHNSDGSHMNAETSQR
jgi:hypothetical protein